MYKIAVIGPESTGKTELSQRLAEYFGGNWVPEYAREYVENLGRKYTFDDVCEIAKKQIEDQNLFENDRNEGFVFFDTDLIITKIWFEYCFQSVPDFVIARLNKSFFDFYLLCDYDLDWIPDKVREHGDDRSYFFELYKNEIEKLSIPYAVISGRNELRIENAVSVIKKYFGIN